MTKIMDADAFVYNSPELETWVASLTDSVDPEQTAVIEAAKTFSWWKAQRRKIMTRMITKAKTAMKAMIIRMTLMFGPTQS